jgi:guanylate kinase
MPHLITLTGPSQAGKSTSITGFLNSSSNLFKPTTIPKYTTRAARPDDSLGEVIACETQLPDDLDLVYQQYDDRYGLRSSEIVKQMALGYSPIIVLNDVRIIIEVKRMFGALVRSVFLYRSAPTATSFFAVAKERGDSDSLKIDIRLRKAEAIYRIYIENIYLFDHVILNTSSTKELNLQISAIVASLAIPKSKLLR